MRDLTKGSPIKVILLFMVPLLIGNVFQQLYSTIDMMLIGQIHGTNTVAAVGATSSITFLVLGFIIGLTNGLSVLVAQSFGAKDFKLLKKSFVTGIAISIMVGIVVTFLSTFFLEYILRLIQVPEVVFEQAYEFSFVVFMGTLAFMALHFFSNNLRAIGDTKTPLYALIVTSIVNIVLVYILLVVLRQSIFFVAVAIVVSQGIGAIFCFRKIIKHTPELRISLKDFSLINRADMAKQARIAFPIAFQTSVIAIGAMIIQVAVNAQGRDAVAAFTAGQRVDQFIVQPMISFSITLSTFTAQNYGAKKYDRIVQASKQAFKMAFLFAISAGGLMILFGENIAGLFFNNPYPEVFEYLNSYFWVMGLCIWLLGMKMVFRGILQGLGRPFAPTVGGVIELVVRAAVVIALVGTFGFNGVLLANPLAWVCGIPILIVHLKRALADISSNEEIEEILA